MDKNLKAAITKGKAEKTRKQNAEKKAAEDARSEHEKFIASQMKYARDWIKSKLYEKIAKEEASGSTYRSIYLGSGNVDGIPAEAIYEAAKKVKGLKPTYRCGAIYQDAEFQGVGEPEYSIGWESPDQEDNEGDE